MKNIRSKRNSIFKTRANTNTTLPTVSSSCDSTSSKKTLFKMRPHLKRKMNSLPSSSNKSLKKISINGIPYKINKTDNIQNKTEYYSIIVQTLNEANFWHYLDIGLDGYNLSDTPVLYSKDQAENIIYFWKRICLDGIIPEDYYGSRFDHKSMRIIKMNFDIQECTNELFLDDDEYTTAMKRFAISKLTTDEAVLLGLENDMAYHIMCKRNLVDDSDVIIAKELDSNKYRLNISEIINTQIKE